MMDSYRARKCMFSGCPHFGPIHRHVNVSASVDSDFYAKYYFAPHLQRAGYVHVLTKVYEFITKSTLCTRVSCTVDTPMHYLISFAG